MEKMGDNNETYNGWANRETWAFNLHWQNDQGLYGMVLDFARDDVQRNPGGFDTWLGRQVIDYVTEELPELSPELWESMRSDVGSFWRINESEVGAAVREALGIEGG